MEDMLRLAAVAVVGAVAVIIVRKASPETAFFVTLAAAALILFSVLAEFKTVSDFMEKLTSLSAFSQPYISILLKVLGISVVSRIASELCRGAGENALAVTVELLGTIAALTASLPLFAAVLELASTFI